MRHLLKYHTKQFEVYSATFGTRCIARTSKGERDAVVLEDVRDTQDNTLADHLWTLEADSFHGLKLRPGQRIKFVAIARLYSRSDGSLDYTLTGIRSVKAVL